MVTEKKVKIEKNVVHKADSLQGELSRCERGFWGHNQTPFNRTFFCWSNKSYNEKFGQIVFAIFSVTTRLSKQFDVYDTNQQTSGIAEGFCKIVFFEVTLESSHKAIYTLIFFKRMA